MPKSKQPNGKLVPFLRKLQVFVTSVVPKAVGAWNEPGTRFMVFDQTRFDELVKNHFQWSGVQTFHRQLSLYDFSKEDTPTWSFGHACFLRDSPAKISEIKRYSKAGTKVEETAAEDDAEEGGASRVQSLEQSVTSLQNMVDDLSVKLAKIQTALSGSGQVPNSKSASQPRQTRKHKGQQYPLQRRQVPDTQDDKAADRMEDVEEQYDFDEDDLISLDPDEEARSQDFVSSFLATSQFQSALSSTALQQHQTQDNSASLAAKSAPRQQKIY
jgi:hypothetical protein